ncbi:MAG: hypothetical protein HUJ58_02530 [Erysipelotrichaceae bacterium]|nr:hypothetical protein [Erysipelotrichaceae bacterium]
MMNIRQIEQLIKNNTAVNEYEITEITQTSKQAYYVFDKLETLRSNDTTSLSCNLYVNIDDKKGTSSFNVIAADTEQTIHDKIESTLSKAKLALNPQYPLTPYQKPLDSVTLLPVSDDEILKNVAEAVFRAKTEENESLNATEIFVDTKTTHFINSNGVDARYNNYSYFIETIPTYKGKEEVELYYSTRRSDLCYEQITKDIEEALHYVKYRANAKKLADTDIPSDTPVYIKGDMFAMFMNAFAEELNYRSTFYHSNHYSVNDILSENPFTVTMKGMEEGCLTGRPVDAHGYPLTETTIVEKGKAVSLWGDLKTGTYLNQDTVTGQYPCFVISGYEPVNDEYFNQPHIEICNFSAPQLEQSSGYFGGEVRLALYKNGNTVIPLTGFSLSGNIFNSIKTVRFSADTDCSSTRGTSYKGPKWGIFTDITLQK